MNKGDSISKKRDTEEGIMTSDKLKKFEDFHLKETVRVWARGRGVPKEHVEEVVERTFLWAQKLAEDACPKWV